MRRGGSPGCRAALVVSSASGRSLCVMQAVTSRLAQFQIDSINVVMRGALHAAVLAAGPYDPGLLERAGLSSSASTLRVLGPPRPA